MKKHRSSLEGAGGRGWGVLVLQQVNKWGSTSFYATTPARTPPGLCCVLCFAYVLGIQLTEDALRTVLNVGLHHSCRLHRGGCNPIPFGRAAVQPVKRKRALLCALTLSPPLLPFLPSVTLFLPHLFTPCSVRLVGGAHASGIVASHCSPTDQAPVKSARHGGPFYPFFSSSQMSLPVESTACTPVRWRARACSHQRRRRIYLRVRCPHTVRAISPPRTQTWTSPIVTEEEKGKHTGLQGWGSTAL